MRRISAAALVAAPVALLVGVNAIATRRFGVRTAELLQDPATLGGFPAWFGAFSHVGILLWAATAAICLFAARVVRPVDPAEADFLRFSGFLSVLLCLDDLFLLHEQGFPALLAPAGLSPRVDEMIVLGAYGVVSAAYFARHLDRVLRGPIEWLAVAALAFGGSVLLGLWEPGAVGDLLEDGLKLLGISAWLAYYALASAGAVRSAAPAA